MGSLPALAEVVSVRDGRPADQLWQYHGHRQRLEGDDAGSGAGVRLRARRSFNGRALGSGEGGQRDFLGSGIQMNAHDKVIEVIERETGCAGLSAATDIEALGVDSLEYLQLITTIRREIGEISDEAVARACTVGELAQAVETA